MKQRRRYLVYLFAFWEGETGVGPPEVRRSYEVGCQHPAVPDQLGFRFSLVSTKGGGHRNL